MKKIVTTMFLMSLMLITFAQRQLPMSEYVVCAELIQELTPSRVEQLRAENPAELIRLNYTRINGALLAIKPVGGNTQDMGYLKQYVPEGVTYNEDEIIANGGVNILLWNLPRDQYRTNVFKLQKNGYTVVVNPISVMEERIAAQCQVYGVNK